MPSAKTPPITTTTITVTPPSPSPVPLSIPQSTVTFTTVFETFRVLEGGWFRRMESTSTAACPSATVSKMAADQGWKNTQNRDTNKKKDKPKKKHTQEQKTAYNKEKNDKKREKRKVTMKTCKMARTMIDNDEKHNEEIEKLRKQSAQVK